MAQKIGDAFIEISARLDKFRKQVDGAAMRVQKGFQKVNQKLKTAFSGLGGVIAGAFAVQKIAAFVNESIKLASVAEGIERAFNRIGDANLLKELEEATRGTVSEMDLMQKTVNASNLGVPVKDLAKLFEFATQRAADTGESVDHLVNSIVVGIGRKSPLILDNLGISAVQLREALGGVSLEAASVADIAEAVGRIGEKSMRSVGETTLTAAQQAQQLNSALENVQVRIGKKLIPATNTLKEAWVSALTTVDVLMDSNLTSQQRLIIAFADSETQAYLLEKAYKSITTQAEKDAKAQKARINNQESLNAAYKLGLFETEQSINASGKLTEAQYAVLSANSDLITSYREKQKAQEKNIELTEAEIEAALVHKNELQNLANVLKSDVTKGMRSIPTSATGDSRLGSTDDYFKNLDLSPFEALGDSFEEADFEDYDANLKALAESQAALNEQMEVGQGFALGFGQAIQSSLASALEGTGNFFQMMGQYLLKLAIQLATAAAAAFVLSQLLPGIGGIAGANALKGLGGIGGLFGQMSGIGGGGGFGGGSKIFGRDIELSNSRTNTFNSRTTGIGG